MKPKAEVVHHVSRYFEIPQSQNRNMIYTKLTRLLELKYVLGNKIAKPAIKVQQGKFP